MDRSRKKRRGVVLMSEAAKRNQRLLETISLGGSKYTSRMETSSKFYRPRYDRNHSPSEIIIRPKSLYDCRDTFLESEKPSKSPKEYRKGSWEAEDGYLESQNSEMLVFDIGKIGFGLKYARNRREAKPITSEDNGGYSKKVELSPALPEERNLETCSSSLDYGAVAMRSRNSEIAETRGSRTLKFEDPGKILRGRTQRNAYRDLRGRHTRSAIFGLARDDMLQSSLELDKCESEFTTALVSKSNGSKNDVCLENTSQRLVDPANAEILDDIKSLKIGGLELKDRYSYRCREGNGMSGSDLQLKFINDDKSRGDIGVRSIECRRMKQLEYGQSEDFEGNESSNSMHFQNRGFEMAVEDIMKGKHLIPERIGFVDGNKSDEKIQQHSFAMGRELDGSDDIIGRRRLRNIENDYDRDTDRKSVKNEENHKNEANFLDEIASASDMEYANDPLNLRSKFDEVSPDGSELEKTKENNCSRRSVLQILNAELNRENGEKRGIEKVASSRFDNGFEMKSAPENMEFLDNKIENNIADNDGINSWILEAKVQGRSKGEVVGYVRDDKKYNKSKENGDDGEDLRIKNRLNASIVEFRTDGMEAMLKDDEQSSFRAKDSNVLLPVDEEEAKNEEPQRKENIVTNVYYAEAEENSTPAKKEDLYDQDREIVTLKDYRHLRKRHSRILFPEDGESKENTTLKDHDQGAMEELKCGINEDARVKRVENEVHKSLMTKDSKTLLEDFREKNQDLRGPDKEGSLSKASGLHNSGSLDGIRLREREKKDTNQDESEVKTFEDYHNLRRRYSRFLLAEEEERGNHIINDMTEKASEIMETEISENNECLRTRRRSKCLSDSCSKEKVEKKEGNQREMEGLREQRHSGRRGFHCLLYENCIEEDVDQRTREYTTRGLSANNIEAVAGDLQPAIVEDRDEDIGITSSRRRESTVLHAYGDGEIKNGGLQESNDQNAKELEIQDGDDAVRRREYFGDFSNISSDSEVETLKEYRRRRRKSRILDVKDEKDAEGEMLSCSTPEVENEHGNIVEDGNFKNLEIRENRFSDSCTFERMGSQGINEFHEVQREESSLDLAQRKESSLDPAQRREFSLGLAQRKKSSLDLAQRTESSLDLTQRKETSSVEPESSIVQQRRQPSNVNSKHLMSEEDTQSGSHSPLDNGDSMSAILDEVKASRESKSNDEVLELQAREEGNEIQSNRDSRRWSWRRRESRSSQNDDLKESQSFDVSEPQARVEDSEIRSRRDSRRWSWRRRESKTVSEDDGSKETQNVDHMEDKQIVSNILVGVEQIGSFTPLNIVDSESATLDEVKAAEESKSIKDDSGQQVREGGSEIRSRRDSRRWSWRRRELKTLSKDDELKESQIDDMVDKWIISNDMVDGGQPKTARHSDNVESVSATLDEVKVAEESKSTKDDSGQQVREGGSEIRSRRDSRRWSWRRRESKTLSQDDVLKESRNSADMEDEIKDPIILVDNEITPLKLSHSPENIEESSNEVKESSVSEAAISGYNGTSDMVHMDFEVASLKEYRKLRRNNSQFLLDLKDEAVECQSRITNDEKTKIELKGTDFAGAKRAGEIEGNDFGTGIFQRRKELKGIEANVLAASDNQHDEFMEYDEEKDMGIGQTMEREREDTRVDVGILKKNKRLRRESKLQFNDGDGENDLKMEMKSKNDDTYNVRTREKRNSEYSTVLGYEISNKEAPFTRSESSKFSNGHDYEEQKMKLEDDDINSLRRRRRQKMESDDKVSKSVIPRENRRLKTSKSKHLSAEDDGEELNSAVKLENADINYLRRRQKSAADDTVHEDCDIGTLNESQWLGARDSRLLSADNHGENDLKLDQDGIFRVSKNDKEKQENTVAEDSEAETGKEDRRSRRRVPRPSFDEKVRKPIISELRSDADEICMGSINLAAGEGSIVRNWKKCGTDMKSDLEPSFDETEKDSEIENWLDRREDVSGYSDEKLNDCQDSRRRNQNLFGKKGLKTEDEVDLRKPIDIANKLEDSLQNLISDENFKEVKTLKEYRKKRNRDSLYSEILEEVREEDGSFEDTLKNGDVKVIGQKHLEAVENQRHQDMNIREGPSESNEGEDGEYIDNIIINDLTREDGLCYSKRSDSAGTSKEERDAAGRLRIKQDYLTSDFDDFESKMRKIKEKMRSLLDKNSAIEERIEFGGRDEDICDDHQWEYFQQQNKLLQLAVSKLWQKEGFDPSRLVKDDNYAYYSSG